ncbi:hypothetical protein FHS29_006309 [Saccharothrix tamanrassetensis]|uniref:Uncharacterized protein n=1 Tax=Saccharothrix tamanrassetensis TaxID=1051531 RepID=A0A841CU67_9PSEU|nr:hypothetical protein [Saccharothrix tamanrassetensis]
MAGRLRGTVFGEMCSRIIEQVGHLDHSVAEYAKYTNCSPLQLKSLDGYRFMLVGEVMDFARQVWKTAGRIEEFEKRQEELCGNRARAKRLRKKTRIPLWAVGYLSGITAGDLRSLTPEDLLHRAGPGVVSRLRELVLHGNLNPMGTFDGPEKLYGGDHSRYLDEAKTALLLMRALVALRVEAAAWEDFFRDLVARLEAVKAARVSRVAHPLVPPRPCRPPGELILAEPRVPRAPGHAVPSVQSEWTATTPPKWIT